jgi:hypothetical protein
VSWDLLVATHDRPTTGAVDEILRGDGSYSREGSLEPPVLHLLVLRPSERAAAVAFTIDGPHAAEIDDLPEALAAGVLAPHYLLQLSVPATAARACRSAAVRLAKQLAQRFRGAVYDAESDALLWPRKRPRSYTAPTTGARIRVVNLDW